MGKLLLGDSSMINNNLKYCREEVEMTQQELGYVFVVILLVVLLQPLYLKIQFLVGRMHMTQCLLIS